MPSLNRIILVGRTVNDPESRLTVEGIPMTKFRLAVERPQFTSGDNVDYIDVVAWRKVAEICGQHMKKNQLVLVEGRIQIRSFEDQMGVRKWVTEVVARDVKMLEQAKSKGSVPTQVPPSGASGQERADDEGLASDLPF